MKKYFLLIALVASSVAFGAEEFDAKKHLVTNSNDWTLALKYLAYFFGIALASFGGTAAQSRAASVALEGIARNPSAADKIQTPMILGLALMESLVIFVLISVFLV